MSTLAGFGCTWQAHGLGPFLFHIGLGFASDRHEKTEPRAPKRLLRLTSNLNRRCPNSQQVQSVECQT
jgi:hypothetical protein